MSVPPSLPHILGGRIPFIWASAGMKVVAFGLELRYTLIRMDGMGHFAI